VCFLSNEVSLARDRVLDHAWVHKYVYARIYVYSLSIFIFIFIFIFVQEIVHLVSLTVANSVEDELVEQFFCYYCKTQLTVV
jgi:hypothetical protein